MDKNILLYLGLQAWSEVDRDKNFADSQWEAIKGKLLAIADLVAPLHRITRKRLLPWWRNRITRARKWKQLS